MDFSQWASYLARGIDTGSETSVAFSGNMYPKGPNAEFLNIDNKPASEVLEDFCNRFENQGVIVL